MRERSEIFFWREPLRVRHLFELQRELRMRLEHEREPLREVPEPDFLVLDGTDTGKPELLVRLPYDILAVALSFLYGAGHCRAPFSWIGFLEQGFPGEQDVAFRVGDPERRDPAGLV